MTRPNRLKAVETVVAAPPVAETIEVVATPDAARPNVPVSPSAVQPLNCLAFLSVTIAPADAPDAPVCTRSISLAFCTSTPSKVALA